MVKLKLFALVVLTILLLGGPALAYDGEGQDYGAWCSECGTTHGPGESCPRQSAPAAFVILKQWDVI